MTITQKIIGVAFGLVCLLGSVHAGPVTCGNVRGQLQVDVGNVNQPPPTDIADLSGSPIACTGNAGNAIFSWDGNDGFNVTATLADVGTSNMTIDLTMFTGDFDTSGFGAVSFWSFTLNGFVFEPSSLLEKTDDFVGGVAVSFDNGNRTAIFTMGAPPGGGYPADTSYTATYTVSSEAVNGVPEPGTWHLVLASLGMLALTSRKSRSIRCGFAA